MIISILNLYEVPVNVNAPLKEDRVYCFANVSRSVDHIVSDDYFENHLSQSLHISYVDWS